MTKVSLVSGNTVSETGKYTFSVTLPCTISTTATLTYTVPSGFNATVPCKASSNCVLISAQQFMIQNYLSAALVQGDTLVLEFSVTNPPTIAPVTQEAFEVVASESGYASFSANSTLDSGQSYIAGSLTDFQISIDEPMTYVQTTYVLSFKTYHTVPAGSYVVFSFPADLTATSATLKNVTIGGALITDSQSTVGSLNLTGAFHDALYSPTTVAVAYADIANPFVAGTYSSFAVSLGYAGYLVDSAGGQSASVTSPANATVSCTLGDPTNSASSAYSFVFKAPDVFTSLAKYLTLTRPDKVSACTVGSIVAVSSGLTVSETTGADPTFRFKVVVPSTASEFSFNISCTNPPTTQPTGLFQFVLTALVGASEKPSLKGYVSVATSKGKALGVYQSAANLPTYPSSPTYTSLGISRSDPATIGIYRINVTAPSIYTPAPTPVCSTSKGYACSLTDGNIVITPYTMWTSSSLQISNIESENPASVSLAVGMSPFKVYTYTLIGGSYYLVEEADDAGRLSVSCDFPCKTCDSANVASCVSCADYTSVVYYLLGSSHTCAIDSANVCGSGYYKNTASHTCDVCSGDCSECAGSTTNCTKCADSTKYLINGTCSASCKAGYYGVTQTMTCYKCDSTCATCDDGTSCKTCVSGYYNSSGSCTATCSGQTYEDHNAMTCAACDTAKCYKCQGSATNCTACYSGLYLNGGSCVSQADCAADLKHIANVSTGFCDLCNTTCATCKNSVSYCTTCSGSLALYGTSCMSPCPAGNYASSNICNPCGGYCATCFGSATACLSCISGMLITSDTKECVVACNSSYYQSGTSACVRCDSSCLTCSGSAAACTACASTYYTYNGACVKPCPDTTYALGTACESCSSSCYTCSGSPDRCTACNSTSVLYNHACLASCPDGTMDSDGSCVACGTACASCEGTASTCTACKNSYYYLYNGTCYAACPETTVASAASTTKTCISCASNCKYCEWVDAASSNSSTSCVECVSGYKILNAACYYVCPDNYYASSNGLQCVKVGSADPTNNVSKLASSSENYSYVPFPTAIASVGLLAIPIGGKVLNPSSMLISNTVVVWSVMVLIIYIVQAVCAIVESELAVFAVTLIAIIVYVALNIAFIYWYKKRVCKDRGFVAWREQHECASRWINVLSCVLSFQIRRLYYCRFASFNMFFAQFEDFRALLVPLNYFTLLLVIFCYFLIIGVDIVGLARLAWGTQLYITLIESLIITVLLVMLLAYELRTARGLPAELLEETTAGYSSLDPEKIRQRILQQVLDAIESRKRNKIAKNLGLTEGNAPERSRTLPDLSPLDSAEDPRLLRSFPCSPKTERERAAPEVEDLVDDTEQPDNVYCEGKTPDGTRKEGEGLDAAVQSPPFDKLALFLKHLHEGTGTRGRLSGNNKLFDDSNPLEVIEESNREDVDHDPTRELNGVILSNQKDSPIANKSTTDDPAKTKTIVDMQIDPQGKETAENESNNASKKDSTPDRHTISRLGFGVRSHQDLLQRTFLEKVKTPDIFESCDGFQFSLARLDAASSHNATDQWPTERLPEVKLPLPPTPGTCRKRDEPIQFPRRENEEEILGSFDKDEFDAIIIRQTEDGRYLDKRGRSVNQYGYLVDSDQNIVSRTGEIVLKKDDFARELALATQEGFMSDKAEEKTAPKDETPSVYPQQQQTNVVAEEAKKKEKEKEKTINVLPQLKDSGELFPEPENVEMISPPEEKKLDLQRSIGEDPLMAESPSDYDALNLRSVLPDPPTLDEANEESKEEAHGSSPAEKGKEDRGNMSRISLLRKGRAAQNQRDEVLPEIIRSPIMEQRPATNAREQDYTPGGGKSTRSARKTMQLFYPASNSHARKTFYSTQRGASRGQESPLGTEGTLLPGGAHEEGFMLPDIEGANGSAKQLVAPSRRRPQKRGRTPNVFQNLRGKGTSDIHDFEAGGDLSSRIESNYKAIQDKLMQTHFPGVDTDTILSAEKSPAKQYLFAGNRHLYRTGILK